MQRISRSAIWIFFCIIVVGCNINGNTPKSDSSLTLQPLPIAAKTEFVLTPTQIAGTTTSEPMTSSNADGLLKSAVANLQNAVSFQMTADEVRAYQIIDTNGQTKQVYGGFNTNYTFIRSPMLKVYANCKYRYDPQAEFSKYESYTYQENDRYFIRFFENAVVSMDEEISYKQIEPVAGDVYQTLVKYAGQAEFVTENNGTAVYILDHPEWYKLKGAIGFADLGFLNQQENGEQLIKQYVVNSYPNVKTIRFTIYVSVNEQVITKVVVDDKDFMVSVLAEVDRALIEQGGKPENLTSYEVMDVNGTEYLFSSYNEVQDFEIPS